MPSSTDSRRRRHGAIRNLIRRRRVHSQAELGDALASAGHEVNQSTLCRDLRDLGISKVDGIYRLPIALAENPSPSSDELTLPGRRAIARYLTGASPAGGHLLVLRTAIGTASAVGLAIDAEAWPEVVGTIAGDDTLFLATGSARDQHRVLSQLRSIGAEV